jgi:hypothetical protein
MSKRRRSERIDRPRTQAAPRTRDAVPAAPPPGPAEGKGRPWLAWVAAAIPAIAALALYLRTLAPTVATGDSGELATVAATLGLAHPPGYPTFTMLGHAFTWLPIGDAAYRINLMSAVLDAAAVLVACLIVGRLIEAAQRRAGSPATGPGTLHVWLGAAVGGFALAISTGFWRYSLVAEVFALSNLLALILLALMLEWSRRPERMRVLWVAAAVGGLALTNQQTILFAAPGLLVLLGIGLTRYVEPPPGRQNGRPMPWRQIGIAVLIGGVGLLPYLYLPLAAAAGADTVWGDPTSIGGFIAIVARSAYGTFSLTVRDTSGSALEHLGLFGGYLVSAFTPAGLAVAAAGAAWLAARRTGEAIALAAWFLVAGPVFLVIANPPLTDPITRGVLERFYLLPSLPVALAIGVGAWQVTGWIGRLAPAPGVMPARLRSASAITGVAALLVGLGTIAAARLPDVDQSGNRVAEAYADDLLGGLPPDTLLLMRSDENYTSVTYAQQVRGIRPDVVAVDVELLKLADHVQLIEKRHPDIDIPFPRYDGGIRRSLADLITQELAVRPVFVVGKLEEDLGSRFDIVDHGLADQYLRNGEQPDKLAVLRADPGLFDRLHPQEGIWPESTWEAAIAANYADVAFQTGVALQELGPQPNADEVERLYRTAIRVSPTIAGAYKNLGVLLQTNGAPSEQIIPLWEAYLALNPEDPEAGVIQATIDRLRAEASPAP